MMLLKAFLVGGALCMLGQILVDRTRLTPARILSGYVVAGVVLSALGLYQPLVDFAGAGATVPLTGFGHLLAKGMRGAVQRGGWLGALTGGLTASAAGITAAVFSALICAALFRAKAKK
ncbi:MAG: stage V sporulation protein AE [Oscillospiraceae bacterium]|nr:stage V sporulation protein AE [Oscillospiraceae bacterium]